MRASSRAYHSSRAEGANLEANPAIGDTRNTKCHQALAARMSDLSVRLERIIHLENRLARTRVKSRLHVALRAAVRSEAVAYCRSLDAERAAATHDKKP